ncbi:MAG: phosphotransferase [Succinivibrio sp.]|nr:phosphotransferase [Succinivibrio sp.]
MTDIHRSNSFSYSQNQLQNSQLQDNQHDDLQEIQRSNSVAAQPPRQLQQLTQENKSLEIFSDPNVVHDAMEKAIHRKHKFTGFECFLCVITAGIASIFINNAYKNKDVAAAEEIKNNTRTINENLRNMTPNGTEREITLMQQGRPFNVTLKSDAEHNLFVKLPDENRFLKLPHSLETTRTMISNDICSHIDLFSLEDAYACIAAEDQEINRHNMLLNILGHLTGENSFERLNQFDNKELETLVTTLKDKTLRLKSGNYSEEFILTSNQKSLKLALTLKESEYKKINLKLQAAEEQQNEEYVKQLNELDKTIYEQKTAQNQQKITRLQVRKQEHEQKLSALEAKLAELEAKMNSKQGLNPAEQLAYKLQSKNKDFLSEQLAEAESKLAELTEEQEELKSNFEQLIEERKTQLEDLKTSKEQNPEAPDKPKPDLTHSPKINTIHVDKIIDKLEEAHKKDAQKLERQLNTSVIATGRDYKRETKLTQLNSTQTKLETHTSQVNSSANSKLLEVASDTQDKLAGFKLVDRFVQDLTTRVRQHLNERSEISAKLEQKKQEYQTLGDGKHIQEQMLVQNEISQLENDPVFKADQSQILPGLIEDQAEFFARLNTELSKNQHNLLNLLPPDLRGLTQQICKLLGFDLQSAESIKEKLSGNQSMLSSFLSLSFFNSEKPEETAAKLKASLLPLEQDLEKLSHLQFEALLDNLKLGLKQPDGLTADLLRGLCTQHQDLLNKLCVKTKEAEAEQNRLINTLQNPLKNLLKNLFISYTDYRLSLKPEAGAQEVENAEATLSASLEKLTDRYADFLELKQIFDTGVKAFKSEKPGRFRFGIANLIYNPSSKNTVFVKFRALIDKYKQDGSIDAGKVEELKEFCKPEQLAIFNKLKEIQENCAKHNLDEGAVLNSAKNDSNSFSVRATENDIVYDTFSTDLAEDLIKVKMYEAGSLFNQQLEAEILQEAFTEIEGMLDKGSLTTQSLLAIFTRYPQSLTLVCADPHAAKAKLSAKQQLIFTRLSFALRNFAQSLTGLKSELKNEYDSYSWKVKINDLLKVLNHDDTTAELPPNGTLQLELKRLFNDCLESALLRMPKFSANEADPSHLSSFSLEAQKSYTDTLRQDSVSLGKFLKENVKTNAEIAETARLKSQQQVLTAEIRAGWIHNFLADAILDEDGSAYDKQVDEAQPLGTKTQQLITKHAKAIAYMLLDPRALNTLPKDLKETIAGVLDEIRNSGLLQEQKPQDIYSDRLIASLAESITQLVSVDLSKADSELTTLQRQAKKSLLETELKLRSAIDEVIASMVDKMTQEVAADEEEQPNLNVKFEPGSDPLDKDVTLEQLNSSSDSKGNELSRFIERVQATYFQKLSRLDQLSMLSAAIRYSRANKDGFITDQNLFAAALKGAGPILQKMLQKLPADSVDNEIRASIKDMKRNLAPIPEKVIQAHLLQAIETSKGKISKIEVVRSLGAASVGQALLCKVYTKDKPQGIECVVKILRPEITNKVQRELNIFREAARTIPGMELTFEGNLKSILEELNLGVEANNIIAGKTYNNGTDVQSMKLLNLVPPSSDMIIIEKAPGVTFDELITSEEDKVMHEILKPLILSNPKDPTSPLKFSSMDEVENNLKNLDYLPDQEQVELVNKLFKEAQTLQKKQGMLLNFANEWVSKGIYEEGFYHGDLHAGNIMISEDKLTIIDFGNCTKLSDTQMQEIIRMMFAALDAGGASFMESLKKLLSPASLARLETKIKVPGAEEGAPEVEMTLEERLTSIIDAIVKKGSPYDTAIRIKVAFEHMLKFGIEIPSSIYNFMISQIALSNTINELGDKIRSINSLALKIACKTAVNDADESFCYSALMGKNMSNVLLNDALNTQQKQDEIQRIFEETQRKYNQAGFAMIIENMGKKVVSADLSSKKEPSRIKRSFESFFKYEGNKELFTAWQNIRLHNAAIKDRPLTDAEKNEETVARKNYIENVKTHSLALIETYRQEFVKMISVKEKEDEDFVTMMGKVVKAHEWESVKNMGFSTTVKYTFNSLLLKLHLA